MNEHRIAFLATRLRLDSDEQHLDRAGAMLVHFWLFEHFVRDAVVSNRDPAVHRVADDDDRLWTTRHPDVDRFVRGLFEHSWRDEVLAFDLDLRAGSTEGVRLSSVRAPGGRAEPSEVIAESEALASVSDAMGSCFAAWRAARGLGAGRPLEPVDRDGLLEAARRLHARLVHDAPQGADGQGPVDAPSCLPIPFLHTLRSLRGLRVFPQILQMDPDNPAALLDAWIDSAGPLYLVNAHHASKDEQRTHASKDATALRRVAELAPSWSGAYRCFTENNCNPKELLDARATYVRLEPADPDGLMAYANPLKPFVRVEEARRFALRATRGRPCDPDLAMGAVHSTNGSPRKGFVLADASERLAALRERMGDGFHLGHPGVIWARLAFADKLMFAGRLEEAIAARLDVLGEDNASWPGQSAVLQRWRSEAPILASCYGDAAHARADPRGVLQAAAATLPASAGAAASLIDAFGALGEDALACLSFAHAQGGSKFWRHPVSRLAGARALATEGHVAQALEQVEAVVHRSTRERYELDVAGILRVLAAQPLDAWRAEIQRRLERGATHLAASMARDAADFHPDAAGCDTVAAALGARKRTTLDEASLAALSSPNAPAIGRLVGLPIDDLQASDDRVIAWWTEIADGDDEARARDVLALLGHALARYFVATTNAPQIAAGAYRQLASSALAGLAGCAAGHDLPLSCISTFLTALDTAAKGVEEWIVDTWLLRIEGVLQLEDRCCGRVGTLLAGLEQLQPLYRGDVQIGSELAAARRLADTDPARAALSFKRCIRAGTASDTATLHARALHAVHSVETIDAAWTAVVANPFNAWPAIVIAERAFADGQAEVALDVLTRRLRAGSAAWRDEQLNKLQPLWNSADLDVPCDWSAAQQAGVSALQSGDYGVALRCLAWCDSQDPFNAVTLQNLGMAAAFAGRTRDAVRYFSGADATLGPMWAAQQLGAGKHWDESLEVHRYASLWYSDAAAWGSAATAAWFADDDEGLMHAVERAMEHDPSSVALSFVNGFADVCHKFGRVDECESAARRHLAEAGEDPIWQSLGHLNLAYALARRGDYDAALPHAREAARINPLPDNVAEMREAIVHCEKREPFGLQERASASREARALRHLLDGDVEQALALVASATEGRLGRLRMAAARRRDGNDPPVTSIAREVATQLLVHTRGTYSPKDARLRIQAMGVLEDELTPIDPPAALGPRPTAAEFRERFAALGGGALGELSLDLLLR